MGAQRASAESASPGWRGSRCTAHCHRPLPPTACSTSQQDAGQHLVEEKQQRCPTHAPCRPQRVRLHLLVERLFDGLRKGQTLIQRGIQESAAEQAQKALDVYVLAEPRAKPVTDTAIAFGELGTANHHLTSRRLRPVDLQWLGGGPLITLPLRSKYPSWQGQWMRLALASHPTRQPAWVHTGREATNPSAVCTTTTLSEP